MSYAQHSPSCLYMLNPEPMPGEMEKANTINRYANIYAVRKSYFLLVLFLECLLPFPLHVSMPLHWQRQSLGKLAQRTSMGRAGRVPPPNDESVLRLVTSPADTTTEKELEGGTKEKNTNRESQTKRSNFVLRSPKYF
jgi:hypothetical protein